MKEVEGILPNDGKGQRDKEFSGDEELKLPGILDVICDVHMVQCTLY